MLQQLAMLGTAGWAALQALPHLLWDPNYALLYWLVIAFVYWQAARAAQGERALYGREFNPPLRHTLSAAVVGIAAGVAGSLAITLLGIPLLPADIGYVWPLALALMLIEPRWLCFAYAGGLLALAQLLFGWPPIEVPGLLGLVAVLHAIEGVVVALDRERIVTPLYVRVPSGQVVGGFSVQRFWPVPLVLVLALGIPPQPVTGGFDMPPWWPFVHVGGDPNLALFALTPVAAALGYADIAITRSPLERAHHTAWQLLVYSGVLLGLAAYGSQGHTWALWAAALFAPLGHEALAVHGGRRETEGAPAFTASAEGVRVLAALPGATAASLGLRPGDLITAVNGQAVRTREELRAALAASSFFVAVDVRRDDEQLAFEESRFRGGWEGFGLVTVPEEGDAPHVELHARGRLEGWLRRLVGR